MTCHSVSPSCRIWPSRSGSSTVYGNGRCGQVTQGGRVRIIRHVLSCLGLRLPLWEVTSLPTGP